MKKPKKLAKRVYFNHGSYFYVTLQNKWINLGKTESQALLSLSRLHENNIDVMAKHFSDYLKTHTIKKAISTQKNEQYCMNTLIKVFGAMLPQDIKPHHVYKFHQARCKISLSSANKEKSLLSCVLNELMMHAVINTNPCIGVKKSPVPVRKRYVSDNELETFIIHAPLVLQLSIMIAYLTGFRMGDILSLTRDNLKPDGIHIETSKTTRALIILWSDELKKVIYNALALNTDTFYVITNKHGQRYTTSGFKSLFQRHIKRISKEQNIDRFQFRDIRKKAGIDTSENITRFLGHSSDKVSIKHYDILPWEVKPTK